MLEREVKLPFPTSAAAREAILAAGAVLANGRRLQDDSLYDLPDETLRKKGSVVRIRTERWTDRPDTTTLTVKGPVQSSQMTGHWSQLAVTSSMLASSIVLNLSGEISVSRSSERRAAGSAISVPGEAPTGGRRVVTGARFFTASAFAICPSDVTST